MTTDDHARLRALIDAALTAPTRAPGARWSPATAARYLAEWKDWYRPWCRPPRGPGGEPPPRWMDPYACTPETLALYAADQLAAGRALNTVRTAIAAIRAVHRLNGSPVPDGVPALAVLRDHEATLRARGWEPKHAEPVTLDELLAVLAGLDRSTPAGRRDACLLLLTYGGALTPSRLVALNVRDVTDCGAGLHVRPVEPGDQAVTLPHWTIGGEHIPAVCPTETTVGPAGWARLLLDRGANPGSALIRAVDQHGHISGLDTVMAGPPSAAGGRLRAGEIGDVLAGLLARAGDPLGRRLTMTGLRLGGAVHYRAGGATVEQLADHARLAPDSVRLLNIVRTAETWAPPPPPVR